MENENVNQDGSFGLHIQTTKTPKANADTYELKTVDDIFQLAKKLSKKDRKRFLKEFCQGIEISCPLNKVMTSISEGSGFPPEAGELTMPSFHWIND